MSFAPAFTTDLISISAISRLHSSSMKRAMENWVVNATFEEIWRRNEIHTFGGNLLN